MTIRVGKLAIPLPHFIKYQPQEHLQVAKNILAAGKKAEIHVIDISKKNLKEAEKVQKADAELAGQANVTFAYHVSDVENSTTPPKDAPQVISMHGVLRYVGSPTSVIERLWKRLAAGGYLLLDNRQVKKLANPHPDKWETLEKINGLILRKK